VGELEGASGLEQEIFAPWRGDDLDAYGQAGGVVVVDRDGDRR
jgi:hypothetical protein